MAFTCFITYAEGNDDRTIWGGPPTGFVPEGEVCAMISSRGSSAIHP